MRRNNCWLAVLAFSTALPILRHGSARERVPVVYGSQVDRSEVPYPTKQSSPPGIAVIDETDETVSHLSRTNKPNHPTSRVANRNPDLAWGSVEHANLFDHVRRSDDPFGEVPNPEARSEEDSPDSNESPPKEDRAEATNRSPAKINETQEPDRASQVSEARSLSSRIHRDAVNVSPGTTGDVIHRDRGIFRRAASRERGVGWGKYRRGSRGSLVQPGHQYYGHVGSSSRDDDSVTSSRSDGKRKAGFEDQVGDETSGPVASDIPGGIDVRLAESSRARARSSAGRTVNDDGRFDGGGVETRGEVFAMAEKEIGRFDDELKKMQQVGWDGSNVSRGEETDVFEKAKKKLNIDRRSSRVLKTSKNKKLEEKLQLVDFMRPKKEAPEAFKPSERKVDIEYRLKLSRTLNNSERELKIGEQQLSFSSPTASQETSLYSLMTIKRRRRRSTESSSERIRSSSTNPPEAGINSSESRSPFESGWNHSPSGMEDEERTSEEEEVVSTSCKSAGAAAERVYVPGVSSQQGSTVNSEVNAGGGPCSRNQDLFHEQGSSTVVESATIIGIRSALDPPPANRKNKEHGVSDTVGKGSGGLGDGDAPSNEFLASFAVTAGTRNDPVDPTASLKEPWIGNAALIAPVADRGDRADTSSSANEGLRIEKVAGGGGDSDSEDGRDCEDKNAKLSRPDDPDKDNRLQRTDRSNYTANEDRGDRGIEGCFRRPRGKGYAGDGVLDDLKLNGQDGGDRDEVGRARYSESYDADGELKNGGKGESFREDYGSDRVDDGRFDGQGDDEKDKQTASNGTFVRSMTRNKVEDVGVTKLEYSRNREDNYFSGQGNNGKENGGTLKDGHLHLISHDKEKGSKEKELHNGSSPKDNGDSTEQRNNGMDNRGISKDGGVDLISHKGEKEVIAEELVNGSNYQDNGNLSEQSDSDKNHKEKEQLIAQTKDNQTVYSLNHNKEKHVEPNKSDDGSNPRTRDNNTVPNIKPLDSTSLTKKTITKPNKLDYGVNSASSIRANNTKPTQTPPTTEPLHSQTPNKEPVIAATRLSAKDSPRPDKPVEEARARLIVSNNEKLIGRLTGEAVNDRDTAKPGVPGAATNNQNNDTEDKRRRGRANRDKTSKKDSSTTSPMKGSTLKDITKESGNAATNSERGSPAVGRNSSYLENDMNTLNAQRTSNVVENAGKSAGDRTGRQEKAMEGRPRNSRLETGSREPTVINSADNETVSSVSDSPTPKKEANVRSISSAQDFDEGNERTGVIVSEGSGDSSNRNSGRGNEPGRPGSEDVNPPGDGRKSAGLMEDQLRPRKERRSSVRSANPDTRNLNPGTDSNGSDVASSVTSLKINPSGSSNVPGPISLDRPPESIRGEDRSVPSESYESVVSFSEVSWTEQDPEVSSLNTDDLDRPLEIDSTVASLENDDYIRLDDELAGSENASAHERTNQDQWPVKHSAVVEGDLVLGGLMMVHEREDSVTCGPVMPQGGVQALEAMLYTLDWLNDQEIVPGVKIGAHILDDCDKDTYGLEMAVDFIKGSISNIDGAEYHCNKTAVRKVISGVVGAASSVTSIQVANLLRLFRIPQVSFFSTSPELSNKQRFEYFSRTIPSDHYQVKAMVDIVMKMNWSYVSIIYEESNYGIKAFEVLEDLLGENDICIAIKEKLVKDSGVAEETAYDNIVLKLLTKPRAKGCIIFGSDQEVAGVMRAVRRCNATGTFSWIGSDGWSARGLVSNGNEPEVEGTLSVQPQANPVRGFEEYFLNLTVENNRRNPWFVEFWEDHFKCRYPNASKTPYNQRYIEPCTTKERLTKQNTAFEDQLQFVSDAVMAFAYAFKDMHKDLCNGKPGLCDAMKPTKGTELLKYLQKVDFEGLSGDKFKFDKNGDGPARYNIIHFKQTEPGKYKWVRVGEYVEGELRLNRSEIQFKLGHPLPPESVCSLPCEVGQAKKYVEGERCCWHCFNCTQYQIRHPKDETQCIPCRQGTVPDETHSTCRDIPEEFLRPESGWAIGAMSFSASGILITFCVCGVFLKHNDTPVVRASGRELSYVLLCGILLCYLVTFALVLRPTDIVCGIQRFAAGFCFTVVYAALLTKTNRISRIFNASKHSAKRPSFISPRSQLIICSGLVFVQILINGVWIIIDPARAMHHYPTREDNLLVCNSYVDASYMIAFAYPIMLIVVCTVYAVLTRKIPEAFNESKHIGFTMYTTCVIWLAFVPLYFGTGSNVALRITSMSVTISLSASVTIACLFSPKLYIILIRPERNVRQSMMPPRYSTTKSSAVTATNVSSMIAPVTLTGATCDQNKAVKKHIISTIDCWTQSEYYELEVKDQKNGKPAPTVISRLTQTSSNDLEQSGIVGNKDTKENPTSTTTTTKENANTTKQINNNARIGNGPVSQADVSL